MNAKKMNSNDILTFCGDIKTQNLHFSHELFSRIVVFDHEKTTHEKNEVFCQNDKSWLRFGSN